MVEVPLGCCWSLRRPRDGREGTARGRAWCSGRKTQHQLLLATLRHRYVFFFFRLGLGAARIVVALS